MTAPPEGRTPDDRPPAADGNDQAQTIPEWAPVEPLPSSEMFLAAFAGLRPVTAGDILDPAVDLVARQKSYRQAFDVLASGTERADRLKHAVAELITAQSDIDMLIAIIDETVADRLKQRRNERRQVGLPQPLPANDIPIAVVHTESIGDIAARMADLWETVVAKAGALDELPEAEQLVELCQGYDCLAAEIEAGRRLPPGL